MTKYIFVTGGVVSGLGKGITAASLGRLLKARGFKVTMQKFDPYINIDPGTLNPYEHGECYVFVVGLETDLDLGHYERFIDEDLNKYSYLTTGKEYWNSEWENYPLLEVHHLDQKDFDHGGTRKRAAELSTSDIMVFMTQDALPADRKMIGNLVRAVSRNSL